MISSEFLLAALIVVLMPGTGVVYTLGVAIARGGAASVAAALGCTLGIVPAVLAAAVGLSAVLHAGAIGYTVLKYAGAAYLLHLAWKTLRGGGPLRVRPEDGARSFARIARTGALINVLNPKLSVFFLAFLPQFIDPAAAYAPQMAAMSAIFMGLTFAVFVLYGLLAAGLAARTLRSERAMAWISRASAAAFAAMGLRLALSEDPA
ncbi:LysE family translocator [Rhodovulum sp. DZ06]|uniref:LysE family translocator n=1 Tax=Rhodovulum sp. DZ06 TaxID=3425126 RepID=UPI003D3413EE